MKIVNITARDLPDAWFQCIDQILDNGYTYLINRGSYEGQKRLQMHTIVHITHPGSRPLIPDIPSSLGIPNPVAEGYIEGYLPYLMTPIKTENEQYTYGERLSGFTNWTTPDEGITFYKHWASQIDEVIKMYKNQGHGTNQACMEVGMPSDIKLSDPPCLRLIDTMIVDNTLHFTVYFRSWDLWNGFPANLGAIQLMKEYMASEIGVKDGTITAHSTKLHIYDYAWELASIRTNKKRGGESF